MIHIVYPDLPGRVDYLIFFPDNPYMYDGSLFIVEESQVTGQSLLYKTQVIPKQRLLNSITWN